MHGVALSTTATPNSGGVKYATASIIAMSRTKDTSVHIKERPQPLPDDAPSLRALAKAQLPADLQSTLMSIVKTHDIDNIQRPPVTNCLPSLQVDNFYFTSVEPFQAYAIPLKSSAAMPLLSSFAAAGNIPWTTLCSCPPTPAPWMCLSKKDVDTIIEKHLNSTNTSLLQ